MQVEIDGKTYLVEIIKKNNRNTYLRVKNGKIVVTTNYLTSKNSVLKLINDNINSIRKMLDRDRRQLDKSLEFYYFGIKYDVIYGFSDIVIEGNKIYARDSKTLEKYLDKEIRRIFMDRLNYWHSKFTENIPDVSLRIRKMTSRWGVCNVKTHYITLNYNLSKYYISCLDYVVVHELSHLVYPNHSKDFWTLVGKYYPDYKKARKMLKE